MAQTNPLVGVQILKNAMKRKEGNCIVKSTSDGTNGEKFHVETENIEDLVKRKGISDMSSITALDRIRAAISNGNRGMGGGRMIWW